MTPQEAIDFIEKSAMLRILGPIGDEAWQTLKTAALAQQTTNKQSTPCPACGRDMECPNGCQSKHRSGIVLM